MRNESVAILDIRSGEVSFLLGSKGVNGTFVFGDSRSEKYDGYCLDGFFDIDSFRRAVVTVITSVRQNYGGVIGGVCVGVPAPFVSVLTKGHTISFPSKRKLCAQDIDALYDSGLNELMVSGECIRRSEMYFTLGDNRKYFSAEELYGVSTTMLKGGLCYYFVAEYFRSVVEAVLRELGFSEIRYMPSILAQAQYLLPEKKREGYAFLLDVGFLTSSVSVIYGNGIVREEAFNFGTGKTLVALMQALDVEYPVAEEILAASNISGGSVSKDLTFVSERSGETFSVREINEIIKCSLDELCEQVESFFEKHYKDKATTVFTINPISITGEGIGDVRGAAEHISRRLNRLTEIVYPDLPYYDKPACSSRISLLNATLSEKKTRSWIQRIFNGFGGRKK
ncbi:MAG: cell division FtsA domain-containing protein [Clostridia bacterium]|nr:cell division FtsA domain-containing protein [Clostridia bacterium]